MSAAMPEHVVLRINELFHDLEGAAYATQHPEIFQHEESRWKRLSARFFGHKAPATLLDIGSGTGFVPLTAGEFFRSEDTLICSDISATMLEVCRKNLEESGLSARFQFIKINDEPFDLAPDSVDFVTLNSVLHHVPRLDKFAARVDAVLRPGGLLIVGHEPNHRFFNHRFLYANSVAVAALADPRRLGKKIARRLPGARSSSEAAPETNAAIYQSINATLMQEGLTQAPLCDDEIGASIDYHSPTGGKLEKAKGFDPTRLGRIFPGFQVLQVETYSHCGKASDKNALTQGYSSLLSKIFPKSGMSFTAVLRKRQKGQRQA